MGQQVMALGLQQNESDGYILFFFARPVALAADRFAIENRLCPTQFQAVAVISRRHSCGESCGEKPGSFMQASFRLTFWRSGRLINALYLLVRCWIVMAALNQANILICRD